MKTINDIAFKEFVTQGFLPEIPDDLKRGGRARFDGEASDE